MIKTLSFSMAHEEGFDEDEKSQKDNCIFCKIIAGEIPSMRIYEDPEFIGILDINPASEGHVLLLPKRHFQIMPQMPPEIVGNLGLACSAISSKILRSIKCEGTSVFIANGGIAGQRAPHFMAHIIPRYANDGISLSPELKELNTLLFKSIKEKLFFVQNAQEVPKKESNIEEIDVEEEYEETTDNEVYEKTMKDDLQNLTSDNLDEEEELSAKDEESEDEIEAFDEDTQDEKDEKYVKVNDEKLIQVKNSKEKTSKKTREKSKDARGTKLNKKVHKKRTIKKKSSSNTLKEFDYDKISRVLNNAR
jgi:histidine triad (HIT) family protein